VQTSLKHVDRGARLVRDAMQLTVVSVVPEMTVRELIHVLLENSISGVPVLDRDGKTIGVVSMTDVLQLAAHESEIPSGQVSWEPGPDAPAADAPDDDVAFTAPAAGAHGEAAFDAYQVADIMTPIAFTLEPDDTLETAARFLLKGRIHRALVAQDGVLHGIITPFDILNVLEWP
jgi:CBS domain-containing protein